MSLEPSRISSWQALFLLFIAIFGTASLELPGPLFEVGGRSAWISVLISCALTLVTASLWLLVGARWPGLDLFQLPQAAAGRWLGWLISAFLTLWSFSLVTGAAWIGTDVVLLQFLPETPRELVTATIVLPAAMAVHGRLQVVARLNQLVFWALILLLLTYMPLASEHAQAGRLLPLLDQGIGPVALAAFVPIGILAENMMLVSVLPFVSGRVRPWRLLFGLTATVAAAMVALVAWSVAVFGPNLPARFHQPVLKFSHIITIADILERLDAVVIVLWISGVVAKVAFWYWLTCLGTARLMGLKDYRPIVWPMTLITSIVADHWATVSNEYDAGLQSWTTITVLGVGALVPLILLLAGAMRSALPRRPSA